MVRCSPFQKGPGPILPVHVDADMVAYRQGRTRKGLIAYIDISTPDIIEFLNMRVPGDVNRKNLNLHHRVNVTDEFMRRVKAGDIWDPRGPRYK